MWLFPQTSSTLKSIFQRTAKGASATRPLSTRQFLTYLLFIFLQVILIFSPSSSATVPSQETTLCSQKETATCVSRSWILNIGIKVCSMSTCTYSALTVYVSSSRCTITIFHCQLLDSNYKQSFSPCEVIFFQVVIQFSLSSSCTYLASCLRMDIRQLTYSREGWCYLTTSQRASLSNSSSDFDLYSKRLDILHGATIKPSFIVTCLWIDRRDPQSVLPTWAADVFDDFVLIRVRMEQESFSVVISVCAFLVSCDCFVRLCCETFALSLHSCQSHYTFRYCIVQDKTVFCFVRMRVTTRCACHKQEVLSYGEH